MAQERHQVVADINLVQLQQVVAGLSQVLQAQQLVVAFANH